VPGEWASSKRPLSVIHSSTFREREDTRLEFATDCLGGQLTGAAARDHDQGNPRAQQRTQHQAVRFTHAALDAISSHRAAHAPGDRDAQSRLLVAGETTGIDDKVADLGPCAVTLQITEFGAVMETIGGREARGPTRARQPGCLAGMSIARRWRPLARRRLSTLRPPGVAMRAMNPWVRFRRRLWGW
jgi:hypothetical protein